VHRLGQGILPVVVVVVQSSRRRLSHFSFVVAFRQRRLPPVDQRTGRTRRVDSRLFFVVTDLEAVLFFKTEPIFNQIFRELIERRRSSQDFKEKNWIKRLVNLSCGFFGFQENGRSGFRHFSIRSRIPRTFNVSRHQIDFRQGAVCLDSTQYYVVSLDRRPRRRRRRRCGPSNNALALFFTVVEMGKLRLVQALQFFSRHLPPASWSLLYSNVDNLIIALEGAGNLEEAVFLAAGSDGLARYLAEKPLYLAASSQEAEPGQLRLEWLCNSPSWRFIMQRQKTAGLSRLSNRRAFRYALSLMFGKESSVVIPQDRRISKLHSTATVRQNMVCRRRESSPPPP